MGRLIKAEFRKIVTTRLWWALLLPAVALAFGWALGAAALVTDIADEIGDIDLVEQSDISLSELSLSSLALTRAMNIATIFPMIFGALALSSELSRKTITTSFLTAPNRGSVLGAKAVTYVLWGLIYGVVVAGAASLGTVIGGADHLPDAGDWMLVLLAGVVSCVLWTLLGMGVGALLGSPTGALVLLLVYALFVGPVGELVLYGVTEGSHLSGWLPNGSANGLTGATASELLFAQVQDILGASAANIPAEDVQIFDDVVRFAAGAPGAYSLLVSGLIFLGWSMLFFITGLVRNQRRDIT